MARETFFDPNRDLTDDLLWHSDNLAENPGWLKYHVDDICAAIRAGLDSEYHLGKAIDTVLILVSQVVTDEALRPWFDSVAETLEQHPALESNLFQKGFREVIRDFCQSAGVYGKLNMSRPAAVYTLLQAYIKLFRVLIYDHGMTSQPLLVDQALDVARRLNDYMETARLNQALALYYAHHGDFRTAETYGVKAFNAYEHVEDTMGIVDAACTLVVIYRSDARLPKTEYYINRAFDRIESAKPDVRTATLFYEKGVICYCHDQYDLALDYYGRALAIFEEQSATHQMAMAHQAMAQAYVYANDFQKAEAALETARRAWEELNNEFEIVNNCFAQGELEIRRGSKPEGIHLLTRAQEMAYALLEDTPGRDWLIGRIQDYLKANS